MVTRGHQFPLYPQVTNPKLKPSPLERSLNSETKCNWTRGLVGMKWLGESKNMVLNGRRHGSRFSTEQPVSQSQSQTRSQHLQRTSLRPGKSHPSSRRCSRREWEMSLQNILWPCCEHPNSFLIFPVIK